MSTTRGQGPRSRGRPWSVPLGHSSSDVSGDVSGGDPRPGGGRYGQVGEHVRPRLGTEGVGLGHGYGYDYDEAMGPGGANEALVDGGLVGGVVGEEGAVLTFGVGDLQVHGLART